MLTGPFCCVWRQSIGRKPGDTLRCVAPRGDTRVRLLDTAVRLVGCAVMGRRNEAIPVDPTERSAGPWRRRWIDSHAKDSEKRQAAFTASAGGTPFCRIIPRSGPTSGVC